MKFCQSQKCTVTSEGNNEENLNVETVLIKQKENEKLAIPSVRRHSICNITTWIVIGLLAIVLGLVSIKYTLFDLFMNEKLRMTPGLPSFEWWKNPKPEVFCRAYVFQILNSKAFLNGTDTKLKLQEFGPIVYKERLTHSDIEFHENSTLSYTIKRRAEFAPELNEPGILNQTIIVPNVALLGMIAMVNNYGFSFKFGFNVFSKKEQLFINTTVYNYLWNLTTPTLQLVSTYLPFMVPQDNAGVMHNVYSHFEDRVNVRIGEKYGHEQFFMINTFNGRPTAPGYKTENGDCFASIVNSTEGGMYSAFLTKDYVPYYWRKTVCKAVPLYFEKEVWIGSLKGYKYIAKPSLYDRLENSTADCYRGLGDQDLPDGLSDVSKCYHNVPVAVSSPHFYGRSGYWDDHLDGFTPSKEKHGSFAIIEPTSGVPLKQVARSQSNFIVPKLRNLNANAMKISEKVIPMIWIEYYLEKLTPEINAFLFLLVFILQPLKYILPVILLFFGLIFIYIGNKRLGTEYGINVLDSKSLLYLKRKSK